MSRLVPVDLERNVSLGLVFEEVHADFKLAGELLRLHVGRHVVELVHDLTHDLFRLAVHLHVRDEVLHRLFVHFIDAVRVAESVYSANDALDSDLAINETESAEKSSSTTALLDVSRTVVSVERLCELSIIRLLKQRAGAFSVVIVDCVPEFDLVAHGFGPFVEV